MCVCRCVCRVLNGPFDFWRQPDENNMETSGSCVDAAGLRGHYMIALPMRKSEPCSCSALHTISAFSNVPHWPDFETIFVNKFRKI